MRKWGEREKESERGSERVGRESMERVRVFGMRRGSERAERERVWRESRERVGVRVGRERVAV